MKTPKTSIPLLRLILAITASFFILLSSEPSHAQKVCKEIYNGTSQEDADSNRDGRKIIKHLEESSQELYATSGFKNNADIIKTAVTTEGPSGDLYRQAVDILKNEKLQVAIRLPSKVRKQIAQNGHFLNSSEAGESQGTQRDRSGVEASGANIELDQWKNLPDRVKPKYAAAYPVPESGLEGPTSLNAYAGPDKYYFKLDNIRDRLTITPGDSLNRFAYWRGPYALTNFYKPTSWDQLFVPWKDRFLLIPAVAAGLASGRLGFAKIAKGGRPDEYGQQFEVTGQGNMKKYNMPWSPNMDYLELQIWGSLTLDDVEIFEYKTNPPTGPFLKELERRGIKIVDGRTRN